MYFEVCFVVLINAARVFILLSVEIILIHSDLFLCKLVVHACLSKWAFARCLFLKTELIIENWLTPICLAWARIQT